MLRHGGAHALSQTLWGGDRAHSGTQGVPMMGPWPSRARMALHGPTVVPY